jgi:nitroimidazol reductase NimA-like FMN-containing flavoprotein (pyridoxamine 5'-phosphate oxidase superfamily)
MPAPQPPEPSADRPAPRTGHASDPRTGPPSPQQAAQRSAPRPVTEFDPRYSSALNPRPGAEHVTATEWAEAVRHLTAAEIFWVSTVRPDGRLHITPVIAAWHDGALYFSTGPGEQKARNLAHDAHCALTTGGNALGEGLDLVVEGTARQVADPAEKEAGISAFEAKYGGHITSPEGTFHGLGDAIRRDRAALFAVAPATAYGFGRDNGVFTHTRWRF